MAASKTRRRVSREGSIAALKRDLVEALSPLPWVKRVLWDDEYCQACFWVVIDAPPWEREYSDPIYDVHWDMIGKYPDISPQLRLINRVEYGEERMAWAVPNDACVLIDREAGQS